ncbi:MAG: LPS assembly lipoprotein LptE [Pseudomonadota bacterium]
MKRTNLRTVFLCALLALCLSACGFKLRGFGDPGVITQPAHVSAYAFSEVADDLKRSLANSEVELAENAKTAAISVHITDERTRSRTLSVGSDTRVRDIELTYSVSFTLSVGESEKADVTETLTTSRDYTFDSSGVLGSADEEDLLFDEMRRELVSRLRSRMVLASAEKQE